MTDTAKKLATLESNLKQTAFDANQTRLALAKELRAGEDHRRAETKAREEFQALVLSKLGSIAETVSDELARQHRDNQRVLGLYDASGDAATLGHAVARLLAGGRAGMDEGRCRGPRLEHERIENS